MTRNDSIASALTLDVTSPDTNFIDNSVKPTKKDIESLRHKRAAFRFATGTRRAVHLTMVTAEGLEHNSYRNEIQRELTLDDLFVP